MEQKYIRFKKFKDLDLFIQNTLDKYFYVNPWKKLYERTGKFHRDIISDKSTIPDLIIYNKTFNKCDCFLESNENSFIKFPRKRFILRPKYRSEYNPSSTYGKGNEVYYYNKQKINDDENNNINLSSKDKLKEKNERINNEPKGFLKQKLENDIIYQQNNKINDKKPQLAEDKYSKNEDDEDEPEWRNDNVEEYKNTKIEFQAIPKSLEEKMLEEIEFTPEDNNDINDDLIYKNNININNNYKNDNNQNLNNIQNDIKSTDNNIFRELNDFMNNDNNKSNTLKEEKNNLYKIKNVESNKSNNLNNMLNDDFNKYFNIFDYENKYNNIFISVQEPNNKIKKENNNINADIEENNKKLKCSRFSNIMENNEILKEFNKDKELKDSQMKNLLTLQEQHQEEKLKYLQMIQMQRLNNKNFIQQNMHLNNMNNYPINSNQNMFL